MEANVVGSISRDLNDAWADLISGQLLAFSFELCLIHEVRNLGLHLGIELRKDGEPACDEADSILYHSLSNGLSYKVGGGCVLTLCPPMTITQQQLDQALDILEEGIKWASSVMKVD